MRNYLQPRLWRLLLSLIAFAFVGWGALYAQVVVNVSGRAQVERGGKTVNASEVVVWLEPPATEDRTRAAGGNRWPAHPRLTQHNKHFEPHILVIPVGASVEFPNRDPFFHNVFSLFDGKRFDLGLYEAGTTRDVHFDKPGISYIFCNIHPEMSAVVIALDTPYYAISTKRGELEIPNVPAGRYNLHVWSESSLPDALKGMTRLVSISQANASLGLIRLTETQVALTHKNKYGREYDPPAPSSPVYEQP
jgi:plastocyanin